MTNRGEILKFDYVNSVFDVFMKYFLETYNKCFQFQKMKIKQRYQKPWFNAELNKMCKKKCFISEIHQKSNFLSGKMSTRVIEM